MISVSFTSKNDEARMTNAKGGLNVQMTKRQLETFRHSDFAVSSSLGIRHSSFD